MCAALVFAVFRLRVVDEILPLCVGAVISRRERIPCDAVSFAASRVVGVRRYAQRDEHDLGDVAARQRGGHSFSRLLDSRVPKAAAGCSERRRAAARGSFVALVDWSGRRFFFYPLQHPISVLIFFCLSGEIPTAAQAAEVTAELNARSELPVNNNAFFFV